MAKARILSLTIFLCFFNCLLRADEGLVQNDSLDSKTVTPSIQIDSNLSSVPKVIDYQGFLSGIQGQPISGTVTIKFSMWDAAQAGNELWNERQTLDVHLGYFTAHLGSSTSFPHELFENGSRWVQLEVNGEVLTPRKRINSVAHALYAGNSAALGGVPAVQFYTREQAHDHSNNDIDAARLGGSDATQYLTLSQGDARYVGKGIPGSVTGTMIVDGTDSVVFQEGAADWIGTGGMWYDLYVLIDEDGGGGPNNGELAVDSLDGQTILIDGNTLLEYAPNEFSEVTGL